MKPTIKKATLVLLISLVLALICLLIACRRSDKSSDPVTLTIVEATYSDLLNQMKKMAMRGVVFQSSDAEPNEKVVSPEEILEAKVGSNHSYMLLGHKRLDSKVQWSLFPSTPRVGHPVINRYRVELANGREITVAAYEARAIDSDGKEQELIIVFDLTALEKRLRNEKQNEKE